MPWSPDKYNEFAAVRSQPFFDLISHITSRPNISALDLGCGTGELTKILADKLTNATILGIDTSPEMLAKAPIQDNLIFAQRSIEDQLASEQRFDLILANASLQWVEGHHHLFTQIIDHLHPGGQLAIQMPCQVDNVLNVILLDLVQEEPFATALGHWKRLSPLLTLDEYATLLFDAGSKHMVIYQKVYPIISQAHNEMYDFISGSTLVPYMEKLPVPLQQELELSFKQRIQAHFPTLPALYAFKRLIIYAQF